jgi:hypothetical protein
VTPLTGYGPLSATSEVRRILDAVLRLRAKIPEEPSGPAWELATTLGDVADELSRALRSETGPFDRMLAEARAS